MVSINDFDYLIKLKFLEIVTYLLIVNLLDIYDIYSLLPFWIPAQGLLRLRDSEHAKKRESAQYGYGGRVLTAFH
jgi:hypothetical protein